MEKCSICEVEMEIRETNVAIPLLPKGQFVCRDCNWFVLGSRVALNSLPDEQLKTTAGLIVSTLRVGFGLRKATEQMLVRVQPVKSFLEEE